jgi:hypothetical protein
MMTKIESIWDELSIKKEKENAGGFVVRRYEAELKADFFAGIRVATNQYSLLYLCQREYLGRSLFKDQLSGIEIGTHPYERDSNKLYLMIALKGERNRDVFAALVEDLIASTGNETDERRVLRRLEQRLGIWQALLDGAARPGLTREQQIGLYGELKLMMDAIEWMPDCMNTLLPAWIGPEGENRDFQAAGFAIEVKSSTANRQQKITISNERQLDPTHLQHLYLVYYALEAIEGRGQTLNMIVQELRDLVEAIQPRLLPVFNTKLLCAGYYQHHAVEYDALGYEIRLRRLFEVQGDFPRIQEGELRPGVGEVKYSITLDHLEQYEVQLSEILQHLR